MPSRPSRLRLAASFLAPLLFGLSFGCGYVAALSVGAMDAITPIDQPLVATIDHGSARITAPQPTGAMIVVSRCSAVEIDPLRSVQDRSPPALAS